MAYQINWKYTHDYAGFTVWERISKEKVTEMLKQKFPKNWQQHLGELERFNETEITTALWSIRKKPTDV